MVASGIEPIALPFRGGPYEHQTQSFAAGERVYPWVILGPVRTEQGYVSELHALYELVIILDTLGQPKAFYQFMRLIPEKRLRSEKFSIRIRPQLHYQD